MTNWIPAYAGMTSLLVLHAVFIYVKLNSHFLLPRQKESNPRKGDPGLPPLRGALRCSTGQAAAELALRAQTVLADTS